MISLLPGKLLSRNPCPHTLPSILALTHCPHTLLSHLALTPCPNTLLSHLAITPCSHTLPRGRRSDVVLPTDFDFFAARGKKADEEVDVEVEE